MTSLRERVATPARAAGVYALLVAGALAAIGPLLLTVSTAIKTPSDFASHSALAPPQPPSTVNFAELLGGSHNLTHSIWVTAAVTAFVVLTQVTFSILAAFAFARLTFPGREPLFWVYLSTLMIPQAVTVVPLYLMMVQFGLRDTFWGLVLPLCFGSPYAIFLLRERFRAIPQEVVDAARLDGVSTLDMLVEIVIPLSRPIIVTLTLITVVSQWNSFMWPRIVTSGTQWQVLTVATAALQGQYNSHWTLVTAAAVIAMAPIVTLFVLTQKHIVRSILITGFR
ncbi:MAG: carbohydrate ABC transporter permease [Bifidobacteriaceae bacterium]|jgi:multiple sugar transport system permease protein|nr:carbohydrate ABC transporter permease [Bifidobacteriaceae bacterium]